MRYFFAGAIALSVLGFVLPATMLAQSGTAGLSISPAGYLLVSETRVDRSDYYYTYKAVLYNTGGALTGVTATITSLASNVTIVAGQGTLQFSPVPAGSSASPSQSTSTNTFSILVNTGVPFYWSQVSWSFNNPFADPGPNQTGPVLGTVTLNGSGSTNPSGIGSLIYNWNLLSAPAGSQASLTNSNNMIATLVPDVLGNYVIALTVSNGSQSDTNTITVSTTDIAPTAVPGANQTVSVGATVSLNGTKSTDANGQPLTYQWSFVSTPPASAASLSSVRSPTPIFTADVAGTWIVGLVVNDGTLSSSQATVTITTGNTAPVAVATANPQAVNVNGLVQLDGSKSTDVDGNPLTYLWSLNTTQAPGSKAVLSAANIVNPTFTADVAGTYVAQLIVRDGAIASQPVTVTISTNAVLAPTATAGAAQTKVVVGSIVQLEGSGTDPRGLPLTYTWTLPTFPAGSTAPSSFPSTTQNPTFVADLPGAYAAQLVVNDGRGNSNPATVTITSTSTPPVAVPTTTTPSITIGTTASLSGSSSYDPDNDPITGYSWSLSPPPGSNAKLTGATTEFPAFVPDIVGTYVAQLIVTDEFGSSTPATVSVSAGQMAIALTPNPLNLSSNTSQPLTITLSPGAGVNPVSVSLTGFDGTVISLSSNPVQVPANSTAVNVTVTPLAPGNTSITASATGYLSGNASVAVTTPMIAVSFSNNAAGVGLTHTLGGTITLSTAAPQPSGTTVTLAADTSQSGLVTLNTTRVSIPAGSTTGTFTVTGAQLGTAGVLASASGYTTADATLLVVMLGGVSISNNLVVPPGQSAPLSVQLSSPAPVDGVTVSLQSGNTNILTVSPASVTISAGATTPSVAPQVTGVGAGPTTITASAGGYTGATATVNVANTVSFSTQNTLVSVGGQISFNVLLSSPAPNTGLIVTLNSSTANATVTSSVSFTAGQQSAVAQIAGISAGSATITAISGSPAFSAAAASMSVTVATLSLPCPAATSGEVNVPFSSQVTASAGVTPLTYSVVGTLPLGLSLNTSTGAITGTPTASGVFSIKVTDSTGASASTSCTFTINAALALPCPAVISGDVNTAFNSLLSASGGVTPYTYSVVGTMPNGLALNSSTGAITGTPTVAGSFTIQVKDAAGATAASCKFTINAPLFSPPCPTTTSGHVGVAFNSQVFASGGSGSYVYSVVGTLPAGLTLNNSSGAITGTPTASGTFNIMVTDSAGATTTSCSFSIIGVLSLPCPATTTGDVNTPFSSQLSATGGVTPFTYSVVGTLPNGLALNSSTGAITGTPAATGSFTVQVKDSTGATAASCTFMIGAALALPCPAVTTGEVNTAFSTQLFASGGATPYTYSAVGTLPNGLTLNSSTGTITGTPTATGSFTVQVKDANGVTTASCPITIAAALSLPCSSTTSGQVSTAFNSQASASGGVTPYTYSVVGTLPNGLALNSSTGAITGTPTVAGSFTVQVKDASGVTATSCAYTIGSLALQITTTALPSGVSNLFYSTTLTATGGSKSYFWTFGNAPGWLSLNPFTGVISGTPTRGTGTFQVQVSVTDTSNPQQSASATFGLVVALAPSLQITTPSLPSGALNVAYGATVTASGGTLSYTWSLGAAPSWVKINSSTGAISGTPTGSTGTSQVQVIVTDSGNPPLSASMTYSLVINGGISLPCPPTASGTVNAPFSSQVSAAGGVTPYTYTVVGTIPNGLTLNSSSGAITGTPTVAGTFSVKVTDAAGATATSCVFAISSVSAHLSITTTSLPSGLLNTAYSTTVNASGGTPLFTWSLSVAPGWLQINPFTGMITGTPTRGTGTFQVQVMVTDSSNPPQSASMTFSLAVNGTQLAFVTTSPLPNAIVNQYYSQPISVTGGTAPYNWVTSLLPTSPTTSWLIFDPTGAACRSNVPTLCGYPLAFGTVSVTITVTDSSASTELVSQAFSLTINSTVGTASISLTGGSGNTPSFSVGQNLQVPVTLTFNPPPTGNVTVAISSSSPGTITFTGKPVNDGTPTSIPANSMQITSDAEGSFTFFVQAAAPSGTVMITASSPGLYASGTATVTLANSGFVLQGPNGIGSAFSTYESVSTPLTVGAARLDSSNKFVEYEQLANGQTCSAPLTVASSNLGSVSPTSAFFTASTVTVPVSFTASSVNSGTGTVSIAQPSCASAIPATGTSVGVTVKVDGYVTPATLTIGNDLQIETSVVLNASAPSATPVTLQSNNPGTLQLWCTETGAGSEAGCTQVTSGEILLTIPQGQASSPNFWMRGYASSGSGGYTISSANYGTITANVNFGPSALVIQTPTGTNTNFSMSLSTPSANLIVYTALNNNGALQNQEVAADQSISVNLTATSGIPTVGTISSSPLTIAGATASASTTFVPSALGSATITASSTNGFLPSGSTIESAAVTAGVTGCTLSVNNQITVGQYLEASGSVFSSCLGAAAGTPVTITSNSPFLQLAIHATDPGSSSITVTIPANLHTTTFWVYGMGTGLATGEGASPATVTYTASATGAQSAFDTVNLAPSAVLILGPTEVPAASLSDSISTNGAQILNVITDYLSADGLNTPNENGIEPLAGNVALVIALTNGNATAGTLSSSSVTINPGSAGGTVTFTPQNPNTSTTITETQPAGWIGNVGSFSGFNLTQLSINVTP